MSSSSEFRSLYDTHDAYVERRDINSLAAREIALEAQSYKVPNLLRSLPSSHSDFSSVLEIGCATGEVLAAFPDEAPSGAKITKIGFDISPLNIQAARARYPHIYFLDEDFSQSDLTADLVVLSDVLEHVPDDVGFLRAASQKGRIVLINLPLEDNWANRNRNYGITDESGHLRFYSLRDGLDLVRKSGLEPLQWHQVWSHETQYDLKRRQLRRQLSGAPHSGNAAVRLGKTVVYFAARVVRPFGRRLFASNLFLSAKGAED